MFEPAETPVAGGWFFGAAVLLAAFELYAGWHAIHPDVSDNYRRYYIDRSSTCLDQPVSGAYAFDTEQSFRSEGKDAIKTIRVCGWEGPAGDGLHAVGESSRLRFALPEALDGNLTLMLELVAIDRAAAGLSVIVTANGETLRAVNVARGEPQRFSFTVHPRRQPSLDVELFYPDAIQVGAHDPNTRKRSIKLTAASVRQRR